MFNFKKIMISSVTAILTMLSTGAYSDIIPVTGSYVVLNFVTGFDLQDSDQAHQIKHSNSFRVPSGKKLIVRSVTCTTRTNGFDSSLILNEHVKVNIHILGYSTKAQTYNYSQPFSYSNLQLLRGYGGVPSVTNGMQSLPVAVLTERAYVRMKTEIFNADEFTIRDNAVTYGLYFDYACTLQGNLYNM